MAWCSANNCHLHCTQTKKGSHCLGILCMQLPSCIGLQPMAVHAIACTSSVLLCFQPEVDLPPLCRGGCASSGEARRLDAAGVQEVTGRARQVALLHCSSGPRLHFFSLPTCLEGAA